jgi:hypothetical protein
MYQDSVRLALNFSSSNYFGNLSSSELCHYIDLALKALLPIIMRPLDLGWGKGQLARSATLSGVRWEFYLAILPNHRETN